MKRDVHCKAHPGMLLGGFYILNLLETYPADGYGLLTLISLRAQHSYKPNAITGRNIFLLMVVKLQ
jgi:hypothetical protein